VGRLGLERPRQRRRRRGGTRNTHVNRFARWDGTAWTLPDADGFGLGVSDTVLALEPYDDGDGDGEKLFAGGEFSFTGGEYRYRIATWDGAAWDCPDVFSGCFNAQVPGDVRDFVFFDGPSPALYVATGDDVWSWDGSMWTDTSGPAGNLGGKVNVPAVYDDGSGPALYAGGSFFGGIKRAWSSVIP